MSARTILIVSAVIALIVAVVFAGISATRSALDLGDLPPNFDFRGREITAARRAIIPELEAQLEAVEPARGSSTSDRVGVWTDANPGRATSRRGTRTPTCAGSRSSR